MLITCPSCQAEYNVPGDVPAGRMVKCARCQTKWIPVAVSPPEPSPPPPAPEPLAPRPALQQQKRFPALALAWVASALLVVGVLASAIVWREPVMRAWPPSERLYTMLRLR